MKNLPFTKKKSSGGDPDGKKDIVEEGDLGDLHFTVYKRGGSLTVIHIANKDESLNFKKDCDLFEEELKKLKISEMADGETVTIKGSGANDNLIFKCENGDVTISLQKREYQTVAKLFNALRGKKKN